jgi:hypothetical protein
MVSSSAGPMNISSRFNKNEHDSPAGFVLNKESARLHPAIQSDCQRRLA